MCLNGATYCVAISDIADKMACGYLLGACGDQQSQACINSAAPVAAPNCACSGRLKSITVRYIGESNQTVTASAKDCGVPIGTYAGLDTDQEFTINANTGGLSYLRNYTYVGIAGSPYGNVAIPTSCCEDPIGKTFFPFEVIGWTNTKGKSCGVTGNSGPQGMQLGGVGGVNQVSDFVSDLAEPVITQYPNPAESSATFEFSVPESQDVTVSIVNIRGELVATIYSESAEAYRSYSVTHDVSELQSGIYFVHLTTGEGTIKEKFVIIR